MKKCPVCNQNISKNRPGEHMRTKHPEYKHSRKIKEGTHCFHYYCDTCGMTIGSFGDLVRHYRELHPEAVDHMTEAEKTGVISEKNLTVTDLDRLIEQVNKNVSLLEEARKENRELLRKCTAYVTRIVELQNEMAMDAKNRY